jgi:hypothetical protein
MPYSRKEALVVKCLHTLAIGRYLNSTADRDPPPPLPIPFQQGSNSKPSFPHLIEGRGSGFLHDLEEFKNFTA